VKVGKRRNKKEKTQLAHSSSTMKVGRHWPKPQPTSHPRTADRNEEKKGLESQDERANQQNTGGGEKDDIVLLPNLGTRRQGQQRLFQLGGEGNEKTRKEEKGGWRSAVWLLVTP